MAARLVLALCLCGLASGMAPACGAQTIAVTPVEGLHQALRLSPAQEGAWKLYRAQTSAPNHAQDRHRAAARMLPTLAAPQRMDLVEAEMKQDLSDLQQQSQATRAFYATLTPDQQHTFDIRTLPPSPGG